MSSLVKKNREYSDSVVSELVVGSGEQHIKSCSRIYENWQQKIMEIRLFALFIFKNYVSSNLTSRL